MIRAIVIGLGNMGLSHALALHAAEEVEVVEAEVVEVAEDAVETKA